MNYLTTWSQLRAEFWVEWDKISELRNALNGADRAKDLSQEQWLPGFPTAKAANYLQSEEDSVVGEMVLLNHSWVGFLTWAEWFFECEVMAIFPRNLVMAVWIHSMQHAHYAHTCMSGSQGMHTCASMSYGRRKLSWRICLWFPGLAEMAVALAVSLVLMTK